MPDMWLVSRLSWWASFSHSFFLPWDLPWDHFYKRLCPSVGPSVGVEIAKFGHFSHYVVSVMKTSSFNRWESIRSLRQYLGYHDLYILFAIRKRSFLSKLPRMGNSIIASLMNFISYNSFGWCICAPLSFTWRIKYHAYKKKCEALLQWWKKSSPKY